MQHWEKICETFTERALTLSSDRALAISGIAQIFAELSGDQYIAGLWKSCFHSGLLSVAQGRKLDASGSTVTSHVGIGPTGRGGFGLAVALDLHAPNLSRVEAEDLMRRAH